MTSLRAAILTIGDEILYGQITDTNSQFIAEEVDTLGIRVVKILTISDEEIEIINALNGLEKSADIIFITGGLGPTKDDKTKSALCRFFDTKLMMNDQVLEQLQKMAEKRGRKLNELSKQQALLPEACTIITNELGTAAGMWFEKDDRSYISMPGVPYEMKGMMKSVIIPKIKDTFKTGNLHHKIIKIVGLPESVLAEKISDWESALPKSIQLAYLPSFGEIKLRLTASGMSKNGFTGLVNDEIKKLQQIIPDYIYGYDEDTLEAVIGELLLANKKTLATAESCTGGYAAHRITSVPGSSAYFKGGIVSYANKVKTETLGVRHNTLTDFGAVSEQTVIEMAENIRQKLNTDYGISTSGVAGPDGGTAEKPVGTVWIACSGGYQTVTKLLSLGGNRETVTKMSAAAVLNLLRLTLIKDSSKS